MGKLSTQYLDIGNARIAYREHGAGPTLILLHGNSGSKALFSEYQRNHFKMFHTIAIDSRGHGESISSDTQYSIEQYSEDVIQLCKTKGVTQAAVIGYSDGGNIALFLALKAPRLFTKVLAISPNYLVSGTTDGALGLTKATAKILQALGKVGLPTQKALMRIELMLKDIGIAAEQLGCIQTSLRILYAEHDMVKEEHIKDMGRLIPGATLRKIESCNHLTIVYKQEAIEDMRNYFQKEESGQLTSVSIA